MFRSLELDWRNNYAKGLPLFCKQPRAVMKKTFLFTGVLLLLLSCNSTSEEADTTNANKAVVSDLENFADSLVRLDKYSLPGIATAARYYQKFVPADTVLADSAAVMVLKHSWTVVDTLNQQLYSDTTDYFNLVYKESAGVPFKQKQFQQQLASHHVKLQGDGEGGVYAVLDYDWIVPLLQQKTSVAADAYLSLLAREEKKPTLLDAGLAIDIKELVERLIVSENLVNLPLPKNVTDDVAAKNKFYTGVLINGSDNSPSMDYNSMELTDEFRTGYNYLVKTYPKARATALLKDWMRFVQQKDQKKIEEFSARYAPY
jgi:hypothetical protein